MLDLSAVRSARTSNINLKAMTPGEGQDLVPIDSPNQNLKPSTKEYIFSTVIGIGPKSSNGEPEYIDKALCFQVAHILSLCDIQSICSKTIVFISFHVKYGTNCTYK